MHARIYKLSSGSSQIEITLAITVQSPAAATRSKRKAIVLKELQKAFWRAIDQIDASCSPGYGRFRNRRHWQSINLCTSPRIKPTKASATLPEA